MPGRPPERRLPLWVGHLFDLVFFRTLGVWLLHGEAVAAKSDYTIVVTGVCMFFMPDWLRGRNSIPWKVVMRFLPEREG